MFRSENKRSTKRVISVAAGMLLAAGCSQVLALDPASVDMGPIEFIPTLDVGIEHNSNIYSSNNPKKESAIFTVRPELLFRAQDQLDTYEVTLYLDNGTYGNSGGGDDDYLDYGLLTNGHWEFNDRNKLDVFAEAQMQHDARGSEWTAGDPLNLKEPDEYRDAKLGGMYQLGHEEAIYATLGVSVYDKKYTNHLPTTALRNYRSNDVALTTYFAVLPKTSMFIDLNYADFVYRNARNLDSDEVGVFLGVKWDLNAFFLGRAKLGYAEKNFDDKRLKKADIVAWNIGVDYLPTDFDKISFDSGSNFRETEGSGAAIESLSVSVSWNHKWLENLSTLAMVSYADDDHGKSFVPTATVRNDKTTTAKAGITYNFRRWMDMGLSYSYKDRDSNIAGVDFDQNIVKLDFSFSL